MEAAEPWPPWASVLAWVLASLHLVTAAAKLLDVAGFAAVLGEYRLVPASLLLPVAVLVTGAELTTAVLLALPRQRRAGAIGVALLALANGAALTVTLLRGLSLQNCGCFGVFWARPLSPWSLLEDLALVLLALLLLLRRRPEAR